MANPEKREIQLAHGAWHVVNYAIHGWCLYLFSRTEPRLPLFGLCVRSAYDICASVQQCRTMKSSVDFVEYLEDYPSLHR